MNLNKYVIFDILLSLIASALLATCTFFLSSTYSEFNFYFRGVLSFFAASLPPLSLYFRHRGSSESSKKLSNDIKAVGELIERSKQLPEGSEKRDLIASAENKYEKLANDFNTNFRREIEIHKIGMSQRNLGKLSDYEKLEDFANKAFSIVTNLERSFSAKTEFKFKVQSHAMSWNKFPTLGTILTIECGKSRTTLRFTKIGGESRFLAFLTFEQGHEEFSVTFKLNLKQDLFQVDGLDLPESLQQLLDGYEKIRVNWKLKDLEEKLDEVITAVVKYVLLSNHS